MKHPSRSGFTLIELLSVVAVISILAALLVPAIGRMRDTARSAQCASNLRQMHMILMEDVQNNNNCVPLAWTDAAKTGWITTAFGRMRAANGGKNENNSYSMVFGCPAQLSKIKKRPGIAATYAMNLEPSRYAFNNTYSPVPLVQYSSPSRTVILADGSPLTTTTYNSGFSHDVAKLPEFIHNKRANFLFLDGHVEALAQADIPGVGATLQAGTSEGLFWVGR